jgi:hypothetical protein
MKEVIVEMWKLCVFLDCVFRRENGSGPEGRRFARINVPINCRLGGPAPRRLDFHR